jgi:hypothetical protein
MLALIANGYNALVAFPGSTSSSQVAARTLKPEAAIIIIL